MDSKSSYASLLCFVAALLHCYFAFCVALLCCINYVAALHLPKSYSKRLHLQNDTRSAKIASNRAVKITPLF
ncbi:hypothetical protein HMPREF1579_01147 [Gardnerella vaginalis JCP8066]|nr:hypothetical protein HMPREF1579_01147 [Gardnerella vaginalis JCP8066]